jgi:hypothetical protein
MDGSQLWYPQIVHSSSAASFASFSCWRFAKCSETLPNINLGDASQFGTPKHCIQSQNTSFASFYLSKFSEILWNTPKHYFGSNGVERMVHNFGTPKQWIKARTQVLHVLRAEDHEMLRNTLKHHFGSNGVEWMLHNFDTSKQCIQSRKTCFASFLTCRTLVKWSETLPNIILGPIE